MHCCNVAAGLGNLLVCRVCFQKFYCAQLVPRYGVRSKVPNLIHLQSV